MYIRCIFDNPVNRFPPSLPSPFQTRLEGLIPILQSKQSEDLIGGVKQGANLEKLVQKWEVCACLPCMDICPYVHMYVCTYVRMDICIYGHMCVWTYVRTYVCMDTCVYGHMYVWTHVCMDTCLYGHMFAWTYVCMDTCLYGHMYVWTHVCMDICTYGHMFVWTYVRMDTCLYGHMYVWTYVRMLSIQVVLSECSVYMCDSVSVALPCHLALWTTVAILCVCTSTFRW